MEAHTACQLTANYDPATFDYPRLLGFAVFDEENITSGPLRIGMFSYNVVRFEYRGATITRPRSTIDVLFERRPSTSPIFLEIPAGALRRTVDGYNQGAQAGSDVNFGHCGNGCSRLCRRFMRCGWYHCATTPKVVRAGTAVLGCLTSTASLSQGCMQQTNSARSGISLSDIDEFAEALIYGRIAGHSAATGLLSVRTSG